MAMSTTFLSGPAARVRASVVGIANGRRGRGAAGGAGIAWSGDLFVTSAHVVTGPHATIVTPDGCAVRGDVIRRDAERDIAMVRAPGASVPAVVTSDPSGLRSGSLDRKSTRLNSSHGYISYAVFCLKKKKKKTCRNSARRTNMSE